MGRLVKFKLKNHKDDLDHIFLNTKIEPTTEPMPAPMPAPMPEPRIIHKNNINIFYHMFCITDALERFNRTLYKITKSGLIDIIDNIYVNCVGSESHKFVEKIKSLNLDKIIVSCSKDHTGEADTLNLLRDFTISNPTGKSLYLHSKGVWRNYTKSRKTRPRVVKKDAVQDWIDCMEYFLIEEFNTCIDILNTYDNCGILYWRRGRFSSCYRGNFWWANNKYISKLNSCRREERHQAEWKFLLPNRSKYKNLYSYNGSLYSTSHPRLLYTDKPTLLQ